MSDPFAARRAVADVLTAVLTQGETLAQATEVPGFRALPPTGRAEARRLATDTLRGLSRADALLKPHLRKAPPVPVRNALRAGAVELAQGGAAHGVVHSWVTVVGGMRRHRHLKGLVNAVLRKLAAEAEAQWPDLPVPRLPKWLRLRLRAAWGPAVVAAMEKAHLRGAPLDLTLKEGDPDTWAAKLGAERLPTGSLRLTGSPQVSALPGYEAGDWWVQDAAAALPAQLLAPQAGEAVADLCAAPGGKAMQLAACGADVTAVDISNTRLDILRSNLKRTGLNARVVVEDVLLHQGNYDAILLDAPCSATGTIRRHPDLPYAADGRDISALVDLQARMLDHALGLLRPGGRLVYCTCSLLPEEGEAQVTALLQRHTGLTLATLADQFDPTWAAPSGGLRLRPDFWTDRGGMDGFFMALLHKSA